MKEKYKIFVINPGSTSTKIALFENEEKILEMSVSHDADELLRYPTTNDQLPYRKKVILDFLREKHINISDADAFVGRGGGCVSVPSGVFAVNEKMVEDTIIGKSGSDHPSKLGIQLAWELQKEFGGRAFTMDPTCMDELCEEARASGIRGLPRRVVLHALNLKGIARLHAKNIGVPYADCRLIVCHIDGGISISAHRDGRIIDCNDSGTGDGPYSPTRIGSVSAGDLIDYCRGRDLDEVRKLCMGAGGFVSHFGTSDSDRVHALMDAGDTHARRVWDGMIYQINKYIGAMAAVLEGRVDSILLTGRLLRFDDLVEKIRRGCEWIAPIVLYPGEVEHEALAGGALRVLRGEEEAMEYTGVPVFTGWEDE